MKGNNKGSNNNLNGAKYMILGEETFKMFEEKLGYTKTVKPALIYSQILALSKIKGGCVASNAYFGEKLNVTERAVSGYINKMEEHHLLKRFDEKTGPTMTVKRHLYPIETPYENVNTEILQLFGNVFRSEKEDEEDTFQGGSYESNDRKIPSVEPEATFQNTGRQLLPYNKLNVFKINENKVATLLKNKEKEYNLSIDFNGYISNVDMPHIIKSLIIENMNDYEDLEELINKIMDICIDHPYYCKNKDGLKKCIEYFTESISHY